jgi:SAM-dependent methyltransferase
MTITPEELTNAGERMIVGNMWGYWAHLSIYRFALDLARNKRVLDVGSGSGYGSDFLSKNAAQVLGLDASETAIKFSRDQYKQENLVYEIADLGKPLSLQDSSFELVFSSNVFEHVQNIDLLASECARVMAPDGFTVVAVPPICSEAAMAADMQNQFHVHHIPPTAWEAKLLRFFHRVTCHAHTDGPKFPTSEDRWKEISRPPDQVTIRDTDFEFPEMTAAEMSQKGGSITAVFVCSGRRMPPGAETLLERTPSGWHEAGNAARILGEVRAKAEALQKEIENNKSQLSELTRRVEERDHDVSALPLSNNSTREIAEKTKIESRQSPLRAIKNGIRHLYKK